MIRKTLLVSLIGLALLAGPLVPSCASCCPQTEERAIVIAAGCCDCGRTIERPATPDSSLSERCASPEAVGFAAQPAHVPPARAGASLLLCANDLDFTPSSPPTPRRL